MTITQPQADALSAYLQRIGFQGHVFDPNDHDESVHLIPIPEGEPFWVFSFKPSVSPRVINGGNMFTYGVSTGSFDALVLKISNWNEDAIKQGMKTLKAGGVVFMCVHREVRSGDRALFAHLNIAFKETLTVNHDGKTNSVMVGQYRGKA